MKTKVMYHSRSGNTKKVADAIAKELGQIAEAVPADYPLENVDLLFLGAGIYAGKADKKMMEFITTLNTKRVKNVALFGTSAGKQDAHLSYMRELLKAQGINVIDETYTCGGKFLFFIQRNHPNNEDLMKAQKFAKAVYGKLNR
jgi:flavodoxin